MIPVTQQDVEDRLRRSLEPNEAAQLSGMNTEASALIEGYLGLVYDLDDPEVVIPEPVIVTTSRVIARMYDGSGVAPPVGVDQRSSGMGPFNWNLHYVADSTSGGPWLTAVDKTTLEPYRTGGVACVPLVRGG